MRLKFLVALALLSFAAVCFLWPPSYVSNRKPPLVLRPLPMNDDALTLKTHQTGVVPRFFFYFLLHDNGDTFCHLFKQLFRPHHHYLVVSTNSEVKFMHFLQHNVVHNDTATNVRLIYRPYGGKRGSMAGVEQRLWALSEALRTAPDWSHFFSLSGTDLMIRSIECLEQYISSAPPGRSFISAERMSIQKLNWYGPADRLIGSTGLAAGDYIRVGAPFWAVARPCAADIVNRRQALVSAFQGTLVPEEALFQTAAFHSPVCNGSRDDAPLSFMAWTRCPEALSVGHACVLNKDAGQGPWLKLLRRFQTNRRYHSFFFARRFFDANVNSSVKFLSSHSDCPVPSPVWLPGDAVTRLKVLNGIF